MEQRQVGGEGLEVERAGDVQRAEQPLEVGDRERRDAGRERVRVHQGQALLRLPARRPRRARARGRPSPGGRPGRASRACARAGARRRSARRRCAPRSRAARPSCPWRARWRAGASSPGRPPAARPGRRPTRWLAIRRAVEGGDLVRRDAELLARADAGGHPVDLVAALERRASTSARASLHALDRVRERARPARPPRATRTTLVERQARCPSRTTPSAPDLRGRLGDRRELGALVVDRERVAEDRRREAALGREGEALERARTSLLPGCGRRARRRSLAAASSSSRARARRSCRPARSASGSNPPERASSYSSRSRFAFTRPKRRLGEPVVAALDEPAARLVPAAEVEAERHAGMVSDDDVVELEAELEPALGRPAAALVEVAIAGVEEQRVVGRVELDVGGAELDELVDLLAQDLGDRPEELLQASGRPRASAPGRRSWRTGSGSEA